MKIVNQDSFNNAVKEVQAGKLTYRAASEKYHVDKMKIYRKCKNLHQKLHGGQTTLSEGEEAILTGKLVLLGEWGFPLTYMDLRLVVKGYLDRAGRNVKKFKNNLPGKDWVLSFLKRHRKELSARISNNIKRARASVSTDMINQYFDNLEVTLSGVQPNSIINYDETNLTDDPGSKKIICRRGQKHPEKINDFAKSATSLMFSCTGNGQLLPLYIIYKAENMYESWRTGGPKGTRYGCTKSGWFDQRHFEDWFFTVALPFLKKQPEPRVLIGDNLSSHFSEAVITSCTENNICFTMLPKNSTHLAQPLDVAFFRPLKCKWRSLLQDWRNKGNHGTLSKIHFPPLLRNLLEEIKDKLSENIKSGFRKTGIVPLDRQEILKQLPNQGQNANPLEENENMDNSVIGLLRELRYGKQKPQLRTSRKEKLQVQPGKSVRNMGDDESESENSHIDSVSSGSEEEENLDSSSTSSQEEENEQETASVDYMTLQECDFVVVKLQDQLTKKDKLYVAQISGISENSTRSSRVVEVKFLKEYRGHKDTFVWPDVEESSFVYPHEVMKCLPQPTALRYGRLQFPKNVL